jgi:hypothetical protein
MSNDFDSVITQDLFIFFSFILPILMLNLSTSTLYNGWRHIYFVYPALAFLALVGIQWFVNAINSFSTGVKSTLIIILLIIPIALTFRWMIISHPFQNMYFNNLVRQNAEKYFESDYWGLANREAMENIIKQDNRSKIRILLANPTSFNESLFILKSEDRKKFLIVNDISEADYVFLNYGYPADKKNSLKEIQKNADIFYEVKVPRVTLLTVLKIKN